MIKFYRKIRKKLIEQSKVRNYFFYAIGEIFLVVIGILIALQINTWNEQRMKNKELELLVRLKDELQNNLDVLNRSIAINNKVTKACVHLTQIIRSNSIGSDPELIDDLLVRIGTFNSFDAQTGVSSEIVNSGKLTILKNDALSTRIEIG